MPEVNGKNGSWIKWGVGIIVTFLVVILPFIGNAIIINDKESRARDTKLDDKVDDAIMAQTMMVSDIKVSQVEMKKDIDYIVKKLDKL